MYDGWRAATEDGVEAEMAASLRALEADLTAHVKALCAPLFILFEYFEVPDEGYEQFVQRFRTAVKV